jgi:hypothetical protein
LQARVKSACRAGGLRCSLDFFEDIVVPPLALPPGADFDDAAGCWRFPGDVDVFVGDDVRLRVTAVSYRTARADVGLAARRAGAALGGGGGGVESGAGGTIAAAAADIVRGGTAAYDLEAVPAGLSKTLRAGMLVCGSATSDGASLPTYASVLLSAAAPAPASAASAAPSSSAAASASTALVAASGTRRGRPASSPGGPVPSAAPGGGSTGSGRARAPPPLLPPSYSMLAALPPGKMAVDAAELSGAARAAGVLAAPSLLWPPLTQALTAAASSTWRAELGVAEAAAPGDPPAPPPLFDAPYPLARSHAPGALHTVGATPRLAGAGGAATFFTCEATQSLLPLAPGDGATAAGGAAGLMTAFTCSPAENARRAAEDAAAARAHAAAAAENARRIELAGRGRGAPTPDPPPPATPPYVPPMVVVGSIAAPGLGPVLWWGEPPPFLPDRAAAAADAGDGRGEPYDAMTRVSAALAAAMGEGWHDRGRLPAAAAAKPLAAAAAAAAPAPEPAPEPAAAAEKAAEKAAAPAPAAASAAATRPPAKRSRGASRSDA